MKSVHALCCMAALATVAHADDWTNNGGNASRNGLTGETGPDAAQVLWSGGRSSIIAWQPVTAGRRVFMVRQTGFPPGGEPGGSPVVAMDLDDGHELWVVNIPFNQNDWTTWIAGVSQGQVYASRSGNGASVSANLYALDQATGARRWISADRVDAGAYDGVVFADNGDLIVASFRTIKRIRATDGTTAWTANRVGSVSGNCGGALYGPGVYVADAAPGGTVVKKFDVVTGSFLYQSPVLAGFTIQNTPFVGPDGTVYLSRVQNNASVDFFYAMNDTGAALTVRWSVPAEWTTTSEFAADRDGGVYMFGRGKMLKRLRSSDGTELASYGPIDADFLQPRMAVDGSGRLFLSNGAFSNGRFFSFDSGLNLRWSIPVPNANIGSPAIGVDGTLVIAGVGTSVTAYRSGTPCPADFNGDGGVDGGDVESFFLSWEAGSASADVNEDGGVDGTDVEVFFLAWEAGGCG